MIRNSSKSHIWSWLRLCIQTWTRTVSRNSLKCNKPTRFYLISNSNSTMTRTTTWKDQVPNVAHSRTKPTHPELIRPQAGTSTILTERIRATILMTTFILITNLGKRHKTQSKITILSKMKRKVTPDLTITLTTRPKGQGHRRRGKSTKGRNRREKKMSSGTKPWNNGKWETKSRPWGASLHRIMCSGPGTISDTRT